MRKLITLILAIVVIVCFFNFKNQIKDIELQLEDVTNEKIGLEKEVASLETHKKILLGQVADLKASTDTLQEEVSSLRQAKEQLEVDNKELEIAFQNEYPDIGVTMKGLVENFEYLTQNVDNFKEKGLSLPNEGEVLMGVGGKNFNTRYYIESGFMNYSFNIGGRLEKDNILKIRLNYNNLTNDEEVTIRIYDYTEALLSAYFMALESPMEYTDAVGEKVKGLMETGDYVKGDLVMKCSLDSFNGFTYIKNRHGLLSIFD